MKNKILPFTFLISIVGYGQVGINTTTPQASLDILAKDPSGSSTDKDGILIPRISRLRAQSIISPETSTLVYINDISNGDSTGTTVDVTSTGFYYFNGTKWVKIKNDSDVEDDIHVYRTDGDLISDRTIHQKEFKLNFTSNATEGTSHFTVDDTTLNVDAINNRVGIGTNAPNETLSVNGKGYISNQLRVGTSWIGSGALSVRNNDATREIAHFVNSDNQFALVIKNDKNVGVGIDNPEEKLEVNGRVKINELPNRATDSYVPVKTLVTDINGVVGAVVGLPPAAYDGYYLTALQGFRSANATQRSYTYNQIVSNNCFNADETPNPDATKCNVRPATINNVQPTYTATFNKSSTENDKYMFLSIDYSFFNPTNNSIVPANSFWVNYRIDVYINDVRQRSHSSNYSIAAGGGNTYTANKIFTIDLTGVTLSPTGNTIKIRLVPTRSLIKANAGTANGQFATGTNVVMRTNVNDISFFLYEK